MLLSFFSFWITTSSMRHPLPLLLFSSSLCFLSVSPSQVEGEGDDEVLSCVGGRSFRSVRERWWYIALSKCGVSTDLWPDRLSLSRRAAPSPWLQRPHTVPVLVYCLFPDKQTSSLSSPSSTSPPSRVVTFINQSFEFLP